MSEFTFPFPPQDPPSTAQRRRFRIELRGPVDRRWLAAFDLISFAASETVTTIEVLADQAALRGILTRVWDLNIDLVAVVETCPPAV